MENKTESKILLRDAAIIAGVLVVFSLGYVLFRKPPQMPAPTAQAGVGSQGMGSQNTPGNMGASLELPEDYAGLVATGNKFMDQGNYAVATESYRRALEIDGSSTDVRTDYGACLHGMGLPDRAIEEFRTVLKDDPSHAIAKFNMGVVFYEKHQADSSRSYLQKYLADEPNGRASQPAKELLKDLDG